MLSYLSVKNFAILENIDVNFEAGMTALTGETGAGKSLLIDAIGLLLGDRASSDVVRSGADYCEVKGVFTKLNDAVKEALNEIDIDLEEDELLLTRQVSKTSQNRIKINHQTVTLQDLKKVTQYLADIHTQHDTKRLINKDTYLELIDHYDKDIETIKHTYQETRIQYLESLKAYQTLKKEKDTMLEKIDFYRFQREEIDSYQLELDEEEHLDERLTQLENFDTIFQSIKTSTEALKEKDALENIYEAARALDHVSSYDDTYKTLSERIKSAYYELDDIKDDVANALNNLDFDPDELETLETRKHTLDTLKRKYRKSINDIIAYREDLDENINQLDHYDDVLKEKETTLEQAFKKVKEKALALQSIRKTVAKKIEHALITILKDLELKQTEFKIEFTSHPLTDKEQAHVFKEAGIDDIEFMLSTNIGEPLKPLSFVASGGELSRIMLALKEILTQNMRISLMIFDEIDTGVSGFVASQVAEKMYNISKRTQVITITHLPQVAARANHHAYIYKSSDTSRTQAHIKHLDKEERIQALAEMISSSEVTKSALQSAKELLK